jgi:hypothetical protein
MSKIEERLWNDLLAEPGACHALAAVQPSETHTPSRRAPIAAGGLLLVGALVAAILVLGGSTRTTPAYAVSVNPDGSVTLTLNEVLGVTGANATLEKLGVRVRIARVEAGCTATAEPIHGPGEPSGQWLMSMVEPQRAAGEGWIIHPDAIPQGDTVLITAQLANGGRPVMFQGKAITAVGSSIGLYHGTPPSCSPPITS